MKNSEALTAPRWTYRWLPRAVWWYVWTPRWHNGRGRYVSIGLWAIAIYRGY